MVLIINKPVVIKDLEPIDDIEQYSRIVIENINQKRAYGLCYQMEYYPSKFPGFKHYFYFNDITAYLDFYSLKEAETAYNFLLNLYEWDKLAIIEPVKQKYSSKYDVYITNILISNDHDDKSYSLFNSINGLLTKNYSSYTEVLGLTFNDFNDAYNAFLYLKAYFGG